MFDINGDGKFDMKDVMIHGYINEQIDKEFKRRDSKAGSSGKSSNTQSSYNNNAPSANSARAGVVIGIIVVIAIIVLVKTLF